MISRSLTTERDLADGVEEAIRMCAAGSPILVGSDTHMAIDLWEKAHAVELNDRLIPGRRGHPRTEQLLTALIRDGGSSLGREAGRIEPGALVDLTTVRLDTPRIADARAGDLLSHVVFAATGADVSGADQAITAVLT